MRRICEECGKKEATVVVDEIVGRFEVHKVAVCEQCARRIREANLDFRN